MTNKWIALAIVGCLALLCLWVNMTMEPGADAGDAKTSGHDAMPRFFVSVPDVFGAIQRPPVAFDHDRHTAALEPAGCGACHENDSRVPESPLRFTFQKTHEETTANGLMDAFHEGCISCHEQRSVGPVTCGECHVIRRAPVVDAHQARSPQYYDRLRDTYHKDCTTCHGESAEEIPTTVPLDWKNFYIAQAERAEAAWPRILFDHYLHDRHVEVTQGACGPCHSGSPLPREQIGTERETAHALCINCHLGQEPIDGKTGPIHCGECHDAPERTIEDMIDVPRMNCGQAERILIQFDENSHAKAVPFDHRSHEANSRSCQDCHHKTLRPCQECHTVEGSKEGDGVTLAEAYHQVSSPRSCVGCHENEKKKPDCAGCHQAIPGGLVQSACEGCHTGSLESLDRVAKLPPAEELIPDGVADELTIDRIADEYGPSALPHLAIARNLTDLSNNSSLASHFHTDEMTVCIGCHHLAPMEAKTDIPPCATCHTTRDRSDDGTPTLLGAYHLNCIGCHRQMDPAGEQFPQDCTGCHEENTSGKNASTARP